MKKAILFKAVLTSVTVSTAISSNKTAPFSHNITDLCSQPGVACSAEAHITQDALLPPTTTISVITTTPVTQPKVLETTTSTSDTHSAITQIKSTLQTEISTSTTSNLPPITTKPPPPTSTSSTSSPYYPPQISSSTRSNVQSTTTALAPVIISGPGSNGSTGSMPVSGTASIGNINAMPFSGQANAMGGNSAWAWMLNAVIAAGAVGLL